MELPDTIPDEERGCGHLESGAAYVRTDPAAFSDEGVLPIFVRLDPPIPYKESHFRGYREFPGLAFEAATDGTVTDYEPLGTPGTEGAGYREGIIASMSSQYGLDDDDPERALLSSEVRRHFFRLMTDGPRGDHAGEMPAFRSPDILMHVGVTHYDTPAEFIRESRELGLNKRIPIGSRSGPPVINPGRTRCWLVHPRAIPKRDTEDNDEYVPGIIGYAYLTRVVYTEDDDGSVPQYIQDYAESGYLDIVQTGHKVPYDDEAHTLHDYVNPNSDLDDHGTDGETESSQEDMADGDDGGDTAETDSAEAGTDGSEPADGDETPSDQGDTQEASGTDADASSGEEEAEWTPLPAEESRERMEDKPYNLLRDLAVRAGVTLGQNPTKGDVIAALLSARVRAAPDDAETEFDLYAKRGGEWEAVARMDY